MPDKTIYALATPPGRGGVAIVRVSGPQAPDSIMTLTGRPPPSPRQASYRSFRYPDNDQPIDRGLVVYFKGPASFTGEDIVEYHCHGGPAIVDALLSVLSGLDGFRMAEPGEFTRRAFENGKLDLTAAEAVADLIDAETEQQRLQAFRQMDGALARLYNGWADRLTKALAYIEAGIDFTDEEEIGGSLFNEVRPGLIELKDEITDHVNDRHQGERLRNGIRVALIGAPNTGKSSLVNALARREVAIVSQHAGTTRDIIDVHLNLGGYPVILSDTAGLRPDELEASGQDEIEREGIRRAVKIATDSDIQCFMFDATSLPDLNTHTLSLYKDTIKSNRPALAVFNKLDLFHNSNTAIIEKTVQVHLKPLKDITYLSLSAKTGENIEALTDALTDKIKSFIKKRQTPTLTRTRHREALESALSSLSRALSGREIELIAEDIRLTVRYLGKITGHVDVEDLLDVIFRDFCLGK